MILRRNEDRSLLHLWNQESDSRGGEGGEEWVSGWVEEWKRVEGKNARREERGTRKRGETDEKRTQSQDSRARGRCEQEITLCSYRTDVEGERGWRTEGNTRRCGRRGKGSIEGKEEGRRQKERGVIRVAPHRNSVSRGRVTAEARRRGKNGETRRKGKNKKGPREGGTPRHWGITAPERRWGESEKREKSAIRTGNREPYPVQARSGFHLPGDDKVVATRRRETWGKDTAAWTWDGQGVAEAEMEQRNERQGDTDHQ
ncbi:hypothetical protein DFH06DRAFT_1148062 [Mycena polygramma]|nr:hypothetical protein DFH06DRAFT_1148062 [Mycena polygramma]